MFRHSTIIWSFFQRLFWGHWMMLALTRLLVHFSRHIMPFYRDKLVSYWYEFTVPFESFHMLTCWSLYITHAGRNKNNVVNKSFIWISPSSLKSILFHFSIILSLHIYCLLQGQQLCAGFLFHHVCILYKRCLLSNKDNGKKIYEWLIICQWIDTDRRMLSHS